MDDQLRNTLQEKFDHVALQELMPGFDQAATWTAIDQQLNVSKRRRIPIAWNYAAAALIGILVGIGITRHFADRQITTGALRIDHAFAKAAGDIPSSTIGSAAATSLPLHQTLGSNAPSARVTPQPHDTVQQLAPSPALAAQLAATDTAPSVVVTPRVAPARARHLLDIDTDSRDALLNDNRPRPGQASVSDFIMVRAMPAPSHVEAPGSILPIHR